MTKTANTILSLRLFCSILGISVFLHTGGCMEHNDQMQSRKLAVPNQIVCIPSGSTFEQVIAILKKGKLIKDEQNFRKTAQLLQYKKEKMRPGRFEIQTNWDAQQLISHLSTGPQAPVKLVLGLERLPEDIAGKVAKVIEVDSSSLLLVFRDEAFLAQIGHTPATLTSIFIPNTYEVFWTVSPKEFVKKMQRESNAFWDKNGRRDLAEALKLSPAEVYNLASIVERETNYDPEKTLIAGVYYKRLMSKIKLQANPTCVFAMRDFQTRTFTEYHRAIDSPYNTYIYYGLPPGPISMASIASIDAVLHLEHREYLYFCAKPDSSGTHTFAASWPEHKQNAAKFHQWAANRGK